MQKLVWKSDNCSRCVSFDHFWVVHFFYSPSLYVHLFSHKSSICVIVLFELAHALYRSHLNCVCSLREKSVKSIYICSVDEHKTNNRIAPDHLECQQRRLKSPKKVKWSGFEKCWWISWDPKMPWFGRFWPNLSEPSFYWWVILIWLIA